MLLRNDSALVSRLDAIGSTGLFDSQILSRFGEFIETAQEVELYHMSPKRYAQQTDIATQSAIDLFLYATHAGLLDFNWGVICPSCGAFLTRESGLRWLSTRKRCSLCMQDTEAALDDYIEVAFTISPAVRPIRFHNPEELEFERDGFTTFFSTSIDLLPEAREVMVSAFQSSYHLPTHSTYEIRRNFETSHYMLMVPSTHAVAHIPITDQESAHEVEFELVFEGQFAPEVKSLAPGDGVIRLHNRTKQDFHVGLLRKEREDSGVTGQGTGPNYTLRPYLSGKELINTQTFRELFRTESLPPAGGLEIKSLTLLFTDLKGSTALYDRIGDFNAYALVREHFALLRGIVAARQGAIVKTLGDSIMASFTQPAAALEAADFMRRETQKISSSEELILKIGLHNGACVAVETNGVLDYFGQTVNIAARLKSLAEAGEIICTEAILSSPGAQGVLKKARLQVTTEQAYLKGVGYPVLVYRMR